VKKYLHMELFACPLFHRLPPSFSASAGRAAVTAGGDHGVWGSAPTSGFAGFPCGGKSAKTANMYMFALLASMFDVDSSIGSLVPFSRLVAAPLVPA